MNDREATVHNRIFARWILPRVTTNHDARGGAEHRRELLAGLSGRVIEVGAGMGSNFGHYPRSVKGLVATEPESYLRSLATRAAAAYPREGTRLAQRLNASTLTAPVTRTWWRSASAATLTLVPR